MRKRKVTTVVTTVVTMARISVDCRDGSKDFEIPANDAKRLYDTGKLDWDLTNQMYATPKGKNKGDIKGVK